MWNLHSAFLAFNIILAHYRCSVFANYLSPGFDGNRVRYNSFSSPTSGHLRKHHDKAIFFRGGSSSSESISDVVSDPTQAVAKNLASRLLSKLVDDIKALFQGDFSYKEIIFTIVAVAAIALSCSAMIMEASLLVDVLAWTCVILAPTAAILQRKVGLLESLREMTNQLREQVTEISANNAVLRTQNNRLAKNTKK